MTIVINLIGGPGIGKSCIAAELFSFIKKQGHSAEYVPEYAKKLVWTKKWDKLNNQYMVTTEQFKFIDAIVGQVDYIITDGPIILGLYYNLHNRDNTSNVEITENKIWQYHNTHKSMNIMLGRNMSCPYEQEGRIQSLDESIKIDKFFKHQLDKNNISYLFIDDAHDEKVVETIYSYIAPKQVKLEIFYPHDDHELIHTKTMMNYKHFSSITECINDRYKNINPTSITVNHKTINCINDELQKYLTNGINIVCLIYT